MLVALLTELLVTLLVKLLAIAPIEDLETCVQVAEVVEAYWGCLGSILSFESRWHHTGIAQLLRGVQLWLTAVFLPPGSSVCLTVLVYWSYKNILS